MARATLDKGEARRWTCLRYSSHSAILSGSAVSEDSQIALRNMMQADGLRKRQRLEKNAVVRAPSSV